MLAVVLVIGLPDHFVFADFFSIKRSQSSVLHEVTMLLNVVIAASSSHVM